MLISARKDEKGNIVPWIRERYTGERKDMQDRAEKNNKIKSTKYVIKHSIEDMEKEIKKMESLLKNR